MAVVGAAGESGPELPPGLKVALGAGAGVEEEVVEVVDEAEARTAAQAAFAAFRTAGW